MKKRQIILVDNKAKHESQHAKQKVKEKEKGPKYFINIEGQEYPWNDDTITTEEIIELGGWDPSLGVIEIDKENNERTLQPGEVVYIKPGHGYSKKIRWKRGS